MIEKKTGLNYSQAIALTFPKYMMVCYKDNLPLFKQFAINVMNVNEDLSCEEIAYEGGKRLQDFFVSIGIARDMKEMGLNFTSYEEFQEEIDAYASRNVISKEDLQEIVQMTIGG